MTISIIIAVKTWQNNLEECVDRCQGLDYPDFEILILPDSHPFSEELFGQDKTSSASNRKNAPQIIPTGPLTPARKRDMALDHARGQILAFIDDDAYPRRDWLKNAIEIFADDDVAAVCGPAITPRSDNLRQKASGIIYSSYLVSAKFSYRYLAKTRREVDDYPSCNFLVRKAIMQELGGFNTDFWPGEDTKLCLEITKRLSKKIIYDPEVLVYHHRRPVLIPHLRQIASYASHRGYFVKKYPQTSLRASYFIPSIFLLAIASGMFLSIFFVLVRQIYFLGLFLYLFIVFIFSISNGLSLILPVFSGIILTHFTYGIYFLKGLISKKLKEEL